MVFLTELSMSEYPVDIRWKVQALDRALMKSGATESLKGDFILCLNR